MSDLAAHVERALAFSGRPVLLLVDPVVVEVANLCRDDKPLGLLLITIEARLREDGPRYRGRSIISASAPDKPLLPGCRLFFAATEVVHSSQFGPLVSGEANYALTGGDAAAKMAKLQSLAGDRGGAALFAELME